MELVSLRTLCVKITIMVFCHFLVVVLAFQGVQEVRAQEGFVERRVVPADLSVVPRTLLATVFVEPRFLIVPRQGFALATYNFALTGVRVQKSLVNVMLLLRLLVLVFCVLRVYALQISLTAPLT